MRIEYQNTSEKQMDFVQTGYKRTSGQTAFAMTESMSASVEKNRTLIASEKNKKAAGLADIQAEAEALDANVLQNYMTIMSNTLSEEDYAKLQEEGFDFRNMDPKEAVTIIDKIKAELIRSGQNIAGYTDDIDIDTLTEALGSQVLAEALSQSFAETDLPMTENTMNETAKAWEMLSQLEVPCDGTYHYMVDNKLLPEIQNFYFAQSSGAAQNMPQQARYYAEDLQGYYFESAGEGTFSDGKEIQYDEKLLMQIDKLVEQAGLDVDENRWAARWLFEQKLPITRENILWYQNLKSVEFPVSENRFAKAVANAVAEGKSPVQADLSEELTVYDKAVRLLTRYKNVEEIRLHMTAEVNVKLLKTGFAIDTAPIERVLEAVEQAEREIAEQYFPNDEKAVEKYHTWNDTNQVVSELPELPAQLLGFSAEGSPRIQDWQESAEAAETGVPKGQPKFAQGMELLQFYAEGKALQQRYEQAGEKYETLMTAPRADLGDSIKKAFANVDDILGDLGYEATEENRRLVRILGYNQMEITPERIEQVRAADKQVREVIEKMTPAAVLKMIRDGVDPLRKSFEELNAYFDSQPREYGENAESYSRFLYKMEQKKDITPAERDSYIGIYRLVHQIEKGEGAVVGALVNTQAQIHFSNLLTAARSGKFKSLDVRVTDELGTIERLVRQGNSISEQIERSFTETASRFLDEVSYSEEAEKAYRQQEMEEFRLAAQADEEVVALLERGEIPKTAESLLAAIALEQDVTSPYGKLREKLDLQSFTDAWEKLDDKEAFRKELSQAIEDAGKALEEASFSQEAASVDVREFRLMHKQLTITAALAQKEEYVLPMDLGGELARVHLTLQSGQEDKGLVDISVDFADGQHMEAQLQMRNGKISGYLLGKSAEEVMKCRKTVDIFSDWVREDASFSMDALLSIVDTAERTGFGSRIAGRNRKGAVRQETPAAAGAADTKAPDNRELYRMAKMFLQSAKSAVTQS